MTTKADHNDIRPRPMESDNRKPDSQMSDGSRQGAGSLQANGQTRARATHRLGQRPGTARQTSEVVKLYQGIGRDRFCFSRALIQTGNLLTRLFTAGSLR